MKSIIQSIVHPTDFSDLSGRAFVHALRIAVAARSRLHLIHVQERDSDDAMVFPQVRRILAQWGFIGDNEVSLAIGGELETLVSTTRRTPVQGILSFLDQHASDLLVLATHGRDGLERLLTGSVAETVSRRSAIPTLFVAPGSRGFVSPVSGDIELRRVLVPIDHSPAPARAMETVRRFVDMLTRADISLVLFHVGTSAPVVFKASGEPEYPQPVILRSGNTVDSILNAAIEFDVDLIGMPTAGHHGVLDALRGSTTERVLRHAPCPVLAVQA
jgi:nucleotide-binding universal stress UspA family protein